MKLKPTMSFNHPSFSFPEDLAHALTRSRRMVGDVAAGTGVGLRMSLGLGLILASLLPQLSLAQDDPSASRQPIKHTRRADQKSPSDDRAFKSPATPAMSATPSAQPLEVTKVAGLGKATPVRVEVVDAVPKLNEKHLSAEELRLLRKQLLNQR